MLTQLINNSADLETYETSFNVMFNKSKNLRERQNKEISGSEEFQNLSSVQKQTISDVINQFLSPTRSAEGRCSACRRCASCAPLENLDRKTRLRIVRSRQNNAISENVKLVPDPAAPGKIRVICKLPAPETVDGVDNYQMCVREYDVVTSKLGLGDKQGLQSELDKAKGLGFVVRLQDLPAGVQEALLACKCRFVSMVPCLKPSSISTPVRIAWNLAKVDKSTGVSENDRSLGGMVDLDVARAARSFKTEAHVAVGDIRKFFNMIFVSKADWPRQLFVWRESCNRSAPIDIYIFCRLMFGHRAASHIANTALVEIAVFGESVCSHCKGAFSRIYPEQSTVEGCKGLAHLLAKIVISSVYVDDTIFPCGDSTILDRLLIYTTKLFSLFSRHP